ncbi:hypothetical protein V6Z11_A07G200100 [Gossypium hirsutum]
MPYLVLEGSVSLSKLKAKRQRCGQSRKLQNKVFLVLIYDMSDALTVLHLLVLFSNQNPTLSSFPPRR